MSFDGLALIAGGRTRPSTAANIARNRLGDPDRATRWAPARAAAWRLLERHVPLDAKVAVIGAGNGHDLPLDRLAARAGQLDLFDVDLAALREARRSCPPEFRERVRVQRCDVTEGAADRIAHAVRVGRRPRGGGPPSRCLSADRYDVVIGDLFYSQLLYPALLDAGVSSARTGRALARYGPALTDAVVERMNASVAAGGRMIHLHDVVGWWDGHRQPVALEEILAQQRSEEACALISRCRQPVGTDPRASAERLGARVLETALWEWPFAPDAKYLVCATVTATEDR